MSSLCAALRETVAHLWAVLCRGSDQRAHDARVDVEQVVARHARLARHAGRDDHEVAALERLSELRVASVALRCTRASLRAGGASAGLACAARLTAHTSYARWQHPCDISGTTCFICCVGTEQSTTAAGHDACDHGGRRTLTCAFELMWLTSAATPGVPTTSYSDRCDTYGFICAAKPPQLTTPRLASNHACTAAATSRHLAEAASTAARRAFVRGSRSVAPLPHRCPCSGAAAALQCAACCGCSTAAPSSAGSAAGQCRRRHPARRPCGRARQSRWHRRAPPAHASAGSPHAARRSSWSDRAACADATKPARLLRSRPRPFSVCAYACQALPLCSGLTSCTTTPLAQGEEQAAVHTRPP